MPSTSSSHTTDTVKPAKCAECLETPGMDALHVQTTEVSHRSLNVEMANKSVHVDTNSDTRNVETSHIKETTQNVETPVILHVATHGEPTPTSAQQEGTVVQPNTLDVTDNLHLLVSPTNTYLPLSRP